VAAAVCNTETKADGNKNLKSRLERQNFIQLMNFTNVIANLFVIKVKYFSHNNTFL